MSAAGVLAVLTRRGSTLAVAESLTGGLLAAAFTAVPGASTAFRGGLVVYATDLKERLAGVPDDLLATYGPVSEPVAAALASGVRARLGADYGVATTGVAGPAEHDGVAVGTVFIAVATPAGAGGGVRLALHGDRDRIRTATVDAAIEALAAALERNR